MEKGGLFAWWCRVQERSALRRHRYRPKNCFQPAATPFGLEGGWKSLGRVGPVVAPIGLTEGKEGRSPGPRKRAWSTHWPFPGLCTAGIGADADVQSPTELQGQHRGRGAPRPAGRQKVGRELNDGGRARLEAARDARAHPRAASGALHGRHRG